MPPKRRDMTERRIVRERADQFVAAAKCSQRQAAAKRLRQHDDIRHDAEMFEREELAGSAKAGQHLIEDKQGARAIALFAKSAHETRLGNAHPALGLNRLDHDCCDSRIDPAERRLVTERQMRHRPHKCAERRAEHRIPGERERAHRVAVICAVERSESGTAGAFARGLERTNNRLSTAIGKVHARKFRREQFSRPTRKSNLALDYVLAINHNVQMPPRLRLDRSDHFRMPMAERRDADSRNEIQIAPPVGSYQPRAFSARNLASERRVRSLCETPPKHFTEFTHRDATIMSMNAPLP